MLERIAEAPPRSKARIAGVFYLLTIVTGASALVFVSGRLVTNLIADACYIAVTLLFYDIFEPVNKNLSLTPYNLAPAILAEVLLTLWLLMVGVNVQRWKEQASAAAA